nr:efflux RND transporter periplasmic adaptor subunit [Myxococcota bacterium]
PIGAMLEPGRRLFRIGDLSSLWLIVHAFERDAVRISAGAPVRIALAALPGRTFEGTVARVGGEVESASRTVEVRIDLANEGGVFLPGMSATAWLPVGAEGDMLLAVPAIALQRLEESWVAFVPGEEPGEFEIRQVGRGRDLGDEVEIQSGLRAGERVVVQGAFLLKSEAERARGGGGGHHHH